jgi:hypothetical protein
LPSLPISSSPILNPCPFLPPFPFPLFPSLTLPHFLYPKRARVKGGKRGKGEDSAIIRYATPVLKDPSLIIKIAENIVLGIDFIICFTCVILWVGVDTWVLVVYRMAGFMS